VPKQAIKRILDPLIVAASLMSHHVPLFRFWLRNGQSIGPSALRRLWASACGTDDVTVTREAREAAFGPETHTYSLCGSPKTANLQNVEGRLRRLLSDMALSATIIHTHLS
jgi:hypothetical protein